MRKRPKIAIAAGGTGGHLFPAQQLAQELGKECEIAFIGHRLAENPFFKKEDISFCEVDAALPKKGNWGRFCWASLKGFWQSALFFLSFRPDVVVGFGSYHTFPPLLASLCLRRPFILFEANCVLGKVNRLFQPFARRLALHFPLQRTLKRSSFVSLLPWREKRNIARKEARERFGLEAEGVAILVFGGSQGAKFFNEEIPPLLSNMPVQVIHLTGKGQTAIYPRPARIKEFESEMDFAYSAADLALCRSGAGTVAELIQWEMPALLIPFPHAQDNHQEANARFFGEEVGGGRFLSQKEATVSKMKEALLSLIKEQREKRENIRKWKKTQTERASLGSIVRENL